MRERIRLTPEERLQLEQIERHLRAEDPALVRRLGWTSSRRARCALAFAAAMRARRTVPSAAFAAMIVGAALIVAGMPIVALAIVGYLTMVAGALVLASRAAHVPAALARRASGVWRSEPRRRDAGRG